nr:uncharacterized protein LOC127293157 [Lolium perenne]
MVRIGCAIGGVPAGAPKPLDAPFRNYVNHHGLEEVSKMFSTSVDLDQTVKDFEKMVNDFNGNPVKLVWNEEKHQGQDLGDEDVDEGESEHEEDEADGKACNKVATNLISVHILKDLLIFCWLISVRYC